MKSFEKIRQHVIAKYELKPGELWNTDKRGPRFVGARWELVQRLREDLRWSENRVATETGFDRTMIRNAMAQIAAGRKPHEGSGRKRDEQNSLASNPH